jgi:DNA end-binding protein Ku
MATTVWKGNLTFGLVTFPVRLFRAARKERIPLRRLRRAEPVGARPVVPYEDASDQASDEQQDQQAQQQYVPAAAPPEGAPGQVVKGYEYEKGRFLVVEKDEIAEIAPKTTTNMEILEFVEWAEIDPVYLETSYYVTPDGAGEKPYAVLFDALKESGYVALAEFAMRGRQHAVVIRPGTAGLIAHTMFYSDEIRKNDEFQTEAGLATPKERELARTLIEAMASRFDPAKFKDTYREKLRELIAAKMQGVEAAAPAAIAATPAPVIDILDALKKSLEVRRKPVASERSSVRKREVGRKKSGVRR